jgi:hypothetical protein
MRSVETRIVVKPTLCPVTRAAAPVPGVVVVDPVVVGEGVGLDEVGVAVVVRSGSE